MKLRSFSTVASVFRDIIHIKWQPHYIITIKSTGTHPMMNASVRLGFYTLFQLVLPNPNVRPTALFCHGFCNGFRNAVTTGKAGMDTTNVIKPGTDEV